MLAIPPLEASQFLLQPHNLPLETLEAFILMAKGRQLLISVGSLQVECEDAVLEGQGECVPAEGGPADVGQVLPADCQVLLI